MRASIIQWTAPEFRLSWICFLGWHHDAALDLMAHSHRRPEDSKTRQLNHGFSSPDHPLEQGNAAAQGCTNAASKLRWHVSLRGAISPPNETHSNEWDRSERHTVEVQWLGIFRVKRDCKEEICSQCRSLFRGAARAATHKNALAIHTFFFSFSWMD